MHARRVKKTSHALTVIHEALTDLACQEHFGLVKTLENTKVVPERECGVE